MRDAPAATRPSLIVRRETAPAVQIVEEYEARESLVSKCAKDADYVGQIYLEWTLAWRGNKLAERWFEGDLIHRVPHLRTETAKRLVLAMKDSNPHAWWWSEFVDKGINYSHLNGK